MEIERDNILQKVVAIIKEYDVKKIVLFGSYSRGTQTAGSDIDLLIVKDLPENEIRPFRIEIKKALWNELGFLNTSFDVLVDNEDRIRRRIEFGDLFYQEIYNKGRVIYA